MKIISETDWYQTPFSFKFYVSKKLLTAKAEQYMFSVLYKDVDFLIHFIL